MPFCPVLCLVPILSLGSVEFSIPLQLPLFGCWTMTQHHELGLSRRTQRIASPPWGSFSFSPFLRDSAACGRFSNRNIPLLEALLTLAKPMTSKFLIATRSLVPDSTPLAAAKLSAALPITQEGIGVREATLAALLLPFGAPAALTVAAGLAWEATVVSGALAGGLFSFLAGRFVRDARFGGLN